MLNKLQIKNFKSFNDEEIYLSNLTLLTGTNCSGKSTVIQAILLLAHNVDKQEQILSKQASPINSYRVSIGEFSEIRNRNNNAKEFFIKIIAQEETCSVKISKDTSNDYCVKVQSSEDLKTFFKSSNHKIYYLSANRQGVQDLYNKNIDNFDKYGMQGEFAIDYLDSHKSQVLDESLIIDKSSPTLITQVDYWLKYILNSNIKTESIYGSDKVQTKFYLNIGNKTSSEVRPKNIGSGLSYIISILIMCLSSKTDDLLLIENPEIHLHPKAQSRLADFFVLIANSGIQLIIETHSDHIFNGIRKALCKNQISLDKIAANYFSINKETLNTDYFHINIEQNGRIKNIPNGLFDQFDEDLNVLLGLE